MRKLVLVIEDDKAVSKIIQDYLLTAGFDVQAMPDGESGLRRFRSDNPDVVILDLGLPGRTGLDVLRELRAASSVPVIIVTARGAETDRVVGLELGADDYMVKPFSPRELVARVRAVLRRTEGDTTSTVLRVRTLTIDLDRMAVDIAGEPIILTPSEFRILAGMARHPGRVYTRNQLLAMISASESGAGDRVIDAHIKNLRRKLELDPAAPTFITTVHGVGYRFAED